MPGVWSAMSSGSLRGYPVRVPPLCLLTLGRIGRRAGVEAEVSGDDRGADLAEVPVVGEGVGADADQGFGDTDADLHRDHPGRLMHNRREIGLLPQGGGNGTRVGPGLHGEQSSAHHVCGDKCWSSLSGPG